MLLHIAPYFGYLASLCLVIALLVKTAAKFRIFSILGTIFFIVYGIIFQAWPVLLTNVILFFINVYYLRKLYRHKELFDILQFSGEEKLAERFLDFYKTDIGAYFPAFDRTALNNNINFVVLRDLVIANIFSARLFENGDAMVHINYTVPEYRDFKIGKYIFEKEKQLLISKGVRRIVYTSVANKSHAKFLSVSGFVKSESGWVKELR